MRLTTNLRSIGEIFRRVGYVIERTFSLMEALVGITAGTILALASAVLLHLPDPELLLLARKLTESGTPMPVGDARTILLVIVFGAVIWAAHSCRKTREWFSPQTYGG